MPKGGTQIKKSLPKRTVSAKLQERRQRSWARGQERKRVRQKEQEARHRANIQNGTFNPKVKPAYRIFDPCHYGSHPGEPQAESMYDRVKREQYWHALGKRIRLGL